MSKPPNNKDLQGTSVLVTGGSGFIGSNLVRRLLKLEAEVTVIEDFSTGPRRNIEDLEDQINLIESDISLMTKPLPGFGEISVIFHLAAIPSVPRSMDNPIAAHRANTSGSLRLFEMARQIEPDSIVIASSSSVYGDDVDLPVKEDQQLDPLSPYAASKASMEMYANAYANTLNVPIVTLRLFNVFGPFQDPNNRYAAVIPKFIQAIEKGEQPVIYGDGDQSRDFTYIDNVLDAFILTSVHPELSGNTYNVSTGSPTSVNELFEQLVEISGTDLEPIYDDPRPGDIRHSYADISNIRKDMDYKPSVDFREGLERTYNWYQEQDLPC